MLMAMRRRRYKMVITLIAVFVAVIVLQSDGGRQPETPPPELDTPAIREGRLARDVLAQLPVKGRAPKTGYAREQFGAGWAVVDGCDMRNVILQRDLTETVVDEDGCTVLSGRLQDPYTGKVISFQRGAGTSQRVQIDHVVALSDAWQKGAQALPEDKRAAFANDPLNLLAVDGPANQQKSDSDAASWLPANAAYRCRYVARQIAVKQSYNLWVTAAERDTMQRILARCPGQVLPIVEL